MSIRRDHTPLYGWHSEHDARMVDFAGWQMPVQYTSITTEHRATRSDVGLFDISHMGRLLLYGSDTARFLDAVVTRRIIDMRPGQVRYGLICNDRGGILDDVLVYRLVADNSADNESPTFQIVVNASNRTKVVDWFQRRMSGFHVRLDDVTISTAMIAVQGPKAVPLVNSFISSNLAAMRNYSGEVVRFNGITCYVSRTGYTGEDGCEIICPAEHVTSIWEQLFAAGAGNGLKPAGLGARDSLRLEAAMPLYGHELNEHFNPIQAGLSFAVNLSDREFVGRAALERAASDVELPVRVGLQLDVRRVPRQGAFVQREGTAIGIVTSGVYSPTFDRPIAMAYVQQSAQSPGTRLDVVIREVSYPSVVVPLPFYERGKQSSLGVTP